jgi:hypothetical protein
MTAVCGCGGGTDVRSVLPRVLATAAALVLDADALNAIATDSALQAQLASRARRGRPTVITPHPLEAARLLGCTASDVQADRLAAARQLASRFGVVAVLKGSGTVIAHDSGAPGGAQPDRQCPARNGRYRRCARGHDRRRARSTATGLRGGMPSRLAARPHRRHLAGRCGSAHGRHAGPPGAF